MCVSVSVSVSKACVCACVLRALNTSLWHHFGGMFRFCPFVNMTQSHKKAGFFSGSLGQFHGMSQSTMQFTHGNKCASGKLRETAVSFHCGPTYELSAVHEPSTCSYTAVFSCPEACVSLQLRVSEQDVAILSVELATCLRVVAATTDVLASESDRVRCLPLLQALAVPFDSFVRDGRSHAHTLTLPPAVVNTLLYPSDVTTTATPVSSTAAPAAADTSVIGPPIAPTMLPG
jgi:hypothetical protein